MDGTVWMVLFSSVGQWWRGQDIEMEHVCMCAVHFLYRKNIETEILVAQEIR